MRSIAKAVIGAAIIIALAPLPSAGARASDVSVDTRPHYYFTVHLGMIRYSVNDVVKRWNRNPNVKLTRVKSCANVNPCVDIYERTEMDTQEFSGDPHSIAGVYYPRNLVGEWNYPQRIIEVYTWWQTFTSYADNQRMREKVLCHELGHYLLGPASMPHPDDKNSCLSNTSSAFWPGEWAKAHVNNYMNAN